MFNLERQKVTLKKKGWSYRSAAAELDVTYQYLSDVLNGHRQSKRLVKRIATLPLRHSQN